jgi:hypothetical protein
MTSKKRSAEENVHLIDALADAVYGGQAQEFEAWRLYGDLDGWKVNCSMNYEYVFARHPESNLDVGAIDWEHLNAEILRDAVPSAERAGLILVGSPMTPEEQHAYRVAVAWRTHGCRSATECLERGVDRKWVDLRFVTDSKGRDVYIMLLGDPVELDMDNILESHPRVWNWLHQGLEVLGPFRSQEEVEEWMAANGAYEES